MPLTPPSSHGSDSDGSQSPRSLPPSSPVRPMARSSTAISTSPLLTAPHVSSWEWADPRGKERSKCTCTGSAGKGLGSPKPDPIPIRIQRGACLVDGSENLLILLWGEEEPGREVQEGCQTHTAVEPGLELDIPDL